MGQAFCERTYLLPQMFLNIILEDIIGDVASYQIVDHKLCDRLLVIEPEVFTKERYHSNF
jgi:hypothetical protein